VIYQIEAWTDGGKIDLIPSQLELAWTVKNGRGHPVLLEAFINKVRHDYDLILLDCPPGESVLTEAAYLAGDYIVVPVIPEFLSTIGLPLLDRSIGDFHKNYPGHNITMAGIIFNATEENKPEQIRSRDFVIKEANSRDWPIFQKEVSYSDSYAKGARASKPIFLTEYARYWKIAEFDAVAQEFVSRVGL